MGTMHAHTLKAPCALKAELLKLVLLVKLVETSERWVEGDHTRSVSAHVCVFALCGRSPQFKTKDGETTV